MVREPLRGPANAHPPRAGGVSEGPSSRKLSRTHVTTERVSSDVRGPFGPRRARLQVLTFIDSVGSASFTREDHSTPSKAGGIIYISREIRSVE